MGRASHDKHRFKGRQFEQAEQYKNDPPAYWKGHQATPASSARRIDPNSPEGKAIIARLGLPP